MAQPKYSELALPAPIALHETLDILDSTKIQCFQDCPRRFFYEYILGWRQDTPNVHLSFGSAWHEAMEVLMLALHADTRIGYTDTAVAAAFHAFMLVYQEALDYDPAMGLDCGKDPANARRALEMYAKTWSRDNFETLFTEVAGTVPLTEDRLIHFKMDGIVRDKDGLWGYEHKTAGKAYNSWREKWAIITQVGTYCYAMYCMYGDEAAGVMVNGAILRKPTKTAPNNNEMIRVPIRKNKAQIADWLWTTQHWLQQLDWNFDALTRCSQDDDVLMAFPKNPTSCTKFGCAHPGLCASVPNPLRRAGSPPPGYTVRHWDPRVEQDERTKIVALTEIPIL